MAAIQIPAELDAELQNAADSLGRTKDDLVREASTPLWKNSSPPNPISPSSKSRA